MLSVANKPIVLNAVILSVVMLNVVQPSVVRLVYLRTFAGKNLKKTNNLAYAYLKGPPGSALARNVTLT
jgi:hypothetical protein